MSQCKVSLKAHKCEFGGHLLLAALLSPLALPAATVKALTYDEAYAIVRAEEEEKERTLDESYERALTHPDNRSSRSSIDSAGNETIQISMHPGVKKPEKPKAKKPRTKLDPKRMAEFMAKAGKPMTHITLSGEVDAHGVSELWWRDEDVEHRVFTNANFLYFTGIGNFEDETHRYQIFLMISKRPPHATTPARGVDWRPAPDDFTPGQIEYLPVHPTDPEAADYQSLEAMLTHYAEHAPDMKTTYENRRLLARARKDYLEVHPPKKRPFIMNFRQLLDPGDPRLKR
jgi:hypothetical protein